MNKQIVKLAAVLASAAVVAGFVNLACADEVELPEVAGVFGMESVGDGAWLAIKLEIPPGQALAGVSWYNNDAGTLFDEILVGTGYDWSPGEITEFVTVAENVQGGSSSWSEIEFLMPIVPSLNALYVVFSLPADEALTGRGAGGGPAVGYSAAEDGSPGWLSGEGEVWARLHDDYGFSILAQLVPVEEGMLVKSLGGEDGNETPPIEPFMTLGPNPFNPTIEIRFGLRTGAHTQLDVYDLRGRRVCRLIDEHRDAGLHRVSWQGRDSGNRGVASGVYILRLKAGEVEFNQRVTLVR